jgi:hypothetical protein
VIIGLSHVDYVNEREFAAAEAKDVTICSMLVFMVSARY